MTVPQCDRPALYRRVRQRVWPHRADASGQGGICLFWAGQLLLELHRLGVRATPQAGKAYWPRLHLEHCGGPDPDEAFGFEGNLDSPASRAALADGDLPEIHVWVGLPDSQELLDFSTGDWPGLCQQFLGKDWPGPKPPRYFWASASQGLPAGVCYLPSEAAIAFAVDCLANLVRKRAFV
jgi:hypothetical protein